MQNIDWKNLPFGYMKTNANIRSYFKNGAWSDLEITSSESISLHISATCLHYGQEIFEGMKAYMGKDGKVRLFRWQENCKRMQRSAKGIMMQPVSDEIFHEAIVKAVQLNKEFIPPYGSGGTLYIRPLLLGSGVQIGVKPATEYTFVVFVTPVGPYFVNGFKPVNLVILREHDRAAPLGTGTYKVGGNYAASLLALKKAQDQGFGTTLFLDSKEKKYIDEAGPANFFGIKGNTYVTPESTSILPSITNMSLIDMAKNMGMHVERRKVPVAELESFDEAGACGTAAVISPIGKIYDPDNDKTYSYCCNGEPGKISTRLYERLTAIQFGEAEDIFNWTEVIEF